MDDQDKAGGGSEAKPPKPPVKFLRFCGKENHGWYSYMSNETDTTCPVCSGKKPAASGASA